MPLSSPVAIDRHIESIYRPLAMLAGMQLDVFTPLKDGPLSCADIAVALSVRADKLRPLLYALVNAELLTVDGERFATTPESGEFLIRGRPRYCGGRHEALAHHWHWALQTAGSIRDGKPRMKLEYADQPRETLAAIYRGMHASSLPVGFRLAPRLAEADVTHLADIGGGSGGVAIGACLKVPGLRATIIDLPNIAPVAETFIAEAAVGDRVSTLAADVVAAPPACRFDAAVVKSVIEALSPDNVRALLRHVAQSMDPGGRIFIVGNILDDSRTSPPLNVGFNLVFLNIYDDGQAYTEGELREWLAEAGFGAIEIESGSMSGGVSIITARKPPFS
jgi:2-hydroxy-4-(methylsulfanyl)butanoate S-methyltransferase